MKIAVLEDFSKENGHSEESASEFVKRTKDNIRLLEQRMELQSFVVEEPDMIPAPLKNSTRNHIFGTDVVKHIGRINLDFKQMMYLNHHIPLTSIEAEALVGYGNLKPLILKELKAGNTNIIVIV